MTIEFTRRFLLWCRLQLCGFAPGAWPCTGLAFCFSTLFRMLPYACIVKGPGEHLVSLNDDMRRGL
jgi:hypothetical protein